MRTKFVLLICILLIAFDSFSKASLAFASEVEDVKPVEILDQTGNVVNNDNETSIDQLQTLDENGSASTYSSDSMENSSPINEVENQATTLQSNNETTNTKISVNYSTHVQTYGWLNYVSNGVMSGTQGESKRLEGIKISVDNVQDLGVKYSTHVQDYGWLNYVSNGEMSGTTGQSKRLEAIKIELTGSKAGNYDIYYRVHVQSFGWMNWVKNGELAGTTGQSKRLEAIGIMIVEKGSTPPTNNNSSEPIIIEPSVTYKTHIQDYGWLNDVSDGSVSGTIGQSKRLEAIQISLRNAPFSGGISYKTHVQNYGWMGNVVNGQTSGTIGESKRVEAIQIQLTGEMAKYYDIYYRANTQTYGWLGWAKNGESAGTAGLSKQMEAIEIVIVKKGANPPGSTEKPYLSRPSVSYSTHVETFGWLNSVTDGAISGTQGQGKRIEAIQISLQQNTLYSGNIVYSTKVQDYGWISNVSNGEVSGSTGEAKRLEAIKIELQGEIATYYDIYYRVHSQNFGWLGWAKNGEASGAEGLRLEAIQIVLVDKGTRAPGSTEKPFIAEPSVVYTSHVENVGWLDFVSDGVMSGTEGQSKRLEAIKINLQNTNFNGSINYSTHVQDYGWLSNVSNGVSSGVIGENKQIEAIKIQLTGEISNYYDVYYRVHIETYGWLGWAKNGMNAGSQGLSKRLESMEIKLVPKGQVVDANNKTAFIQAKQQYSVFLDPGHGGYDPGAIAGGVHEADLNLAVAKKVQTLLQNMGYQVYMSRNDSITSVELLDRSKMANALAPDIFVSIHTNSTSGGETAANGIESYYYQYIPPFEPKINGDMHNNPERVANSVSLTNLIQGKMIQYTGANNRGTAGDTFSVLRETAVPATLIEMGFINNSSERQKLVTDYYQNLIAQAIADGINAYFTQP